MTFSPQRLEKAAEAVRQSRVGGITPPQNGTSYDMKLARAAISAYLGDDMVVVPREPSRETLDAIWHECYLAWGIGSKGKTENDTSLRLKTKAVEREIARPFYKAALSASFTERDAG